MHGFKRSLLLSPRRPPLDCGLSNPLDPHLCQGMFQVRPMQSPRAHVCYSSTSGLLLQPLSVTRMIAMGHSTPKKSHMSCGQWSSPSTIVPVDDSVISFTSVEAVEAAATNGTLRFSAELCDAWKRLSESALWISSWTDFPKVARDTCYTIMSLCDSPSG
jgi:hypothetical protein